MIPFFGVVFVLLSSVCELSIMRHAQPHQSTEELFLV